MKTVAERLIFLYIPMILAIIVIGILLFISLKNKAHAENGVIKVYDSDGKLERELKFNYIPNKTRYKRPVNVEPVKIHIDKKGPAKPTGLKVVAEPLEKPKKKKKKSRWEYRRIKDIKNEQVGDQHVTTITRHVKTKGGEQYEEKEIIVDASRQSNSIGSKSRAYKDPPKNYRRVIRKYK